MNEAGFKEIRVYITRRKNTVAKYIETLPILEHCERSVKRLGAWLSRRWWDQEEIHLEGAKEIPAAELEIEYEKCRAGAAQEDIPGLN